MGKTFVSFMVILTLAIITFFGVWWISAFRGLFVWAFSNPFISIPLILAIIFVIIAVICGSDSGGAMLSGTVAGVSIILLIIGCIYQGHIKQNKIYTMSQFTTDDKAESLSFYERTPYDVAVNVSKRVMGDTIGTPTGHIRSIPSTDTYTTMIVRHGLFKGYESVQEMTLPKMGELNADNDVNRCQFSENAGLRFGGGWISNNLKTHIYLNKFWNPTMEVKESDAFAICDEGTPMIYAPMTKWKANGFAPYKVPAGVMVYNGDTGELVHHESMENAKLPVYPISLAKEQRESSVASSGYLDNIRKVVGMSASEDGVNASNPSEFGLLNRDGNKSQYVTPLVPRGQSQSIIGLSTIDNETTKFGELNPVNIHRYKENQEMLAPSTVVANVISNEFDGYKAGELTSYEVIPSKDGLWTVSMGTDQNVLYRISVDRNGIVKAKMSSKTHGDTNTGDITETSTSITSDKSIKDMSSQELEKLLIDVAKELGSRAGE